MKPIALQLSSMRPRSLIGWCGMCFLVMLLLLLSIATAQQTPAGTIIDNHASSEFLVEGDSGSKETESNDVTTEVLGSCSVLVEPNGTVASPAVVQPVAAGESTTFRFDVTNTGNGVSDIEVASIIEAASDVTPDRVVIRYDSDNDGVADTEVVANQIAAFASGETRVVEVTITLPATAQGGQNVFLNLSAACPGDSSTTDDDNIVQAVIANNLADLSLDKSFTLTNDADSNGQVTVGDTVTFTLILRNDGPNDATGVVVTDKLPDGYAYLSDDGAGAYVESTGVWTVGTIAANTDKVLNIVVTVNSTGEYLNVAEVTASDQEDPNSTPNNGVENEDDYDEVDPQIKELADLSLNKSFTLTNDADSNGQVTVGDTVTFTLTLRNDGPNDATGVVVTDKLPDGYAYLSDDGAGAYVESTGVWTVGTIAANTDKVLNIVVTVNATGDYLNKAEVTASDQEDPDSTPNDGIGDDSDTANPQVDKIADLSLRKSFMLTNDADSNGQVTVGDTVTFTLTLRNDGPNDATGVVVTDKLPSGYTYISDDGAGAYVESTGAWTVGTIAANTDKILNIVVTVNATGEYLNVAEVTASDQDDPDSIPNNGAENEDDYDNVDPQVEEIADLSITKTSNLKRDNDGDGKISPGDILTFILTVQNAGPNTARAIVVEDTLPDGYAYVPSSIAGGDSNDDSAAPALRWEIIRMNKDGQRVLTVDVRVLASGTYTNTATVTSDTSDSNPGNNQDSHTPPVEVTDGIRDLTKEANPASGTELQPGQTLRYTIKFTTNDVPVTNVRISDTLSQYLENLSVASTTPVADTATITGRNLDVTYATVPANTTVRIVVEGRVVTAFDKDQVTIDNPGAQVTFTGGSSASNSTQHPVRATGGIDNPRKVVDPSNGIAVVPGDTLRYTITFASRAVALENVHVTDTLSPYLTNPTIISVEPAASSQAINAGVLDVRYTTLEANTAVTIVVEGVVDTLPENANPVAIVNDGASISHDNDGGTPSKTNPTTNPVNQIDLFIEKQASVATVAPGSEITYNIVVGNRGVADAKGVSIIDTMPAELGNVTWSCKPNPENSGKSDCDTVGNGNTASGEGDIDIQQSAIIGVGESLVFTVNATVDASTPDGTLTNTAIVTPPSNAVEITPDDNASTVSTPIISACAVDIKVIDGTKRVDGTSSAPALTKRVPFSEDVFFEYEVMNLSNAKHTFALEAAILETLPSQFDITNVRIFLDDGDGAFDLTKDTLVDAVMLDVTVDGATGSLVREKAKVFVVVQAPDDGLGIPSESSALINLRGFCDDDRDRTPDNDTTVDEDNVTEIEVVKISLLIKKDAKPLGEEELLDPGEDLPYEMLLTNNGSFPIDETIVYDPLPKGLTYREDTWEAILYPGEQRERICVECTFEVLQRSQLSDAKLKEIFEPIAERDLEETAGATRDNTPASEYEILLKESFDKAISVAGEEILAWANFPVLQYEDKETGQVADSALVRFTTIVDQSLIFEGSKILNPTAARAESDTTVSGSAASVAVSAAVAVVPVRLDVLQVGSVLLGTAFLDVDDNDIYNEGDIPVENLRIYLPDGRSTATDLYGRYTFPDLNAGVTSIKVDPITIPGYRLKPTINELAPGFWRERLYSGLITRQDIPFEPPRALVTVDETLTAMRGDVMIVKELYVQENGVLVRLNISSGSAYKGLHIADQMPANARMVSEPVYAGGARGIGAAVPGEGLELVLGDIPAEFNVVVDYLLVSTQEGREKVALTAPSIEWEWR